MFQLDMQPELSIADFLEDYNKDAWLGYMRKTKTGVIHKNLSVGFIEKCDYWNKEDVYLDLNPLKGQFIKRSKASVHKLAVLYADLDIGRDDNPFMSDSEKKQQKQATVDQLEKEVFNKTLAEPNFICDSGRGLYLIYIIYQNEEKTKQEHKNATGRWRRINSKITDELKWYCADSSVSTDESRVLRIPDTINTHNGERVKFYRYSDKVYTLYNIERDFMFTPSDEQMDKLERMQNTLDIKCNVLNKRSIRRFMAEHEKEYVQAYNSKKPTETQLDYAADIADMLNITCPKFRTAGGASRFIKKYEAKFELEKAKRKIHVTYNKKDMTKRMLEKRIRRLEKIVIEAKKDTYREIALFFYRLFVLELTENKKTAEQMTLDLIRAMSCPLNEKEAMRTTKVAEKYFDADTIYKITDEKLASKFGLSADEWRKLIPAEKKEENKELRKARNRRYYEKKLQKAGTTTKQDKIIVRRDEVSRLLSEGKNKNEICIELGISERTYYDDLKAINNEVETNIVQEQENAEIIEKDVAKKLDPISNRGPIGPSNQLHLEEMNGKCYPLNWEYSFDFTLNMLMYRDSSVDSSWHMLWPDAVYVDHSDRPPGDA